MNSYLLILHEVPDESEERLSALVDVVLGLGGGEREVVSDLLHSLPAILCENLTKSEADRWEVALEAAGANVEVIQSEASEGADVPSPPASAAPTSEPAFVPLADVDDLEFALDQLISGEHPAVTPEMLSGLASGGKAAASAPPAAQPTKPEVKAAPPPPPPPPAPPTAAAAARTSTPLPKLGDLESALDDLLGDSARAPEASKPSQRKATVAYDTEELARRLAEIDSEAKGKASPTAPTDEFDLKSESLKASDAARSQAKPAPSQPLTPLELKLDFSDEPKEEQSDFLAELEAEHRASGKDPGRAPAPAAKKESPPKPQAKAAEGLEVEKSPAGKPKAPKPKESGVHPTVSRPGGESKRPVSSASINVSRRNNPVVKNPSAPGSAGGELGIELESGPSSLLTAPPPPPLNSPLSSQTNRVTPVSNEIPIIVSASRQGLPAVSAPEGKKNSTAILIGLVAIFVVFPIAFLMMPDKGPSTAVDPQAIERLLEQQQQMLDDIRATPVPTTGQTMNPNDSRVWELTESTDKEEAELTLSTNLNSVLSGSLQLRGRKFGALLQYDPKVPDQPIIFVREIIAKDLHPQEGSNSLRGEGEALLTSGTVSYRVGLDVTVTADMTSETATMTIDVKGRKNGGMTNGGVGVEQVGPGEFRVAYKKTAVLKPKGAHPTNSDKPEAKPTTDSKSGSGKNPNGSYQRIPMEFPSANPQSNSRR